jgi:multiple sugar transport system ATP-binding protein
MNLVDAEIDGDDVVFAGYRVPLPAGLRPTPGVERLILGIRPEAFEDAAFADPALPQLDATVAVLEDLGADAHVIFPVDAPPVRTDDVRQASDDEALLVADQTLFNARIDARTQARVDATLRLSVDPARFHFFDGATGASASADSASRAVFAAPA